jgi:hypothetical protein
MFARGWLPLHTPPLLGRKPSSVKSRISISSKLIENKILQVFYSGHLRKKGGRGSHQLPIRHPLFPPHLPLARPPQLQRRRVTRLLLSPLFPLHTKSSPVTSLFPLLTQKQGEEVSLAKTLSCRLACFGCLLRNVGAPTFLIFPLRFRTFLPLTGLQHNRGKEERSWPRKFGRGAKGALERPALHWGVRLK